MKTLSIFNDGLLITGSSGFIGSHLRQAISDRQCSQEMERIAGDLSSDDLVNNLTREHIIHRVIHLASSGRPVTPLNQIPDLFVDTFALLRNLTQIVRPSRIVYTSTCAVYGDAPEMPVQPLWKNVNPISSYGLSKAAAELFLRKWGEETRSTVVIFRLGNAVGPGCAGLISALVRHAVQHPGGEPAFHLRGGGRVMRDYFPVLHIVDLLRLASEMSLPPGACKQYNAGSGISLTNWEVAIRVKEAVLRHGITLHLVRDEPLESEEQNAVRLDVTDTEKRFGLPTPNLPEVWQSIDDAVSDMLLNGRAAIVTRPGTRRMVGR